MTTNYIILKFENLVETSKRLQDAARVKRGTSLYK